MSLLFVNKYLQEALGWKTSSCQNIYRNNDKITIYLHNKSLNILIRFTSRNIKCKISSVEWIMNAFRINFHIYAKNENGYIILICPL